MEDRSIGSWFGNTASICGQIFPLKLFTSTVVSTTGTLNTWVAFASGHGVVNDRLSIEVADSEQHLRLIVNQRDNAVVGRQESFLAEFVT